ncbi:unnamed protein product [Pieris macdunnoughi]|uniref:Glucosidase 2 subunit beta n=1 Tax=Pieris macdunnoughi TaxID=345717 RepID=A0A821V610_9NEOP|nr:unnamed protein product [Pieris macdunnoughi]
MIYSNWLSKLQSFVLVTSSLVIFVLSDVPRPRGVSLSKASLYSPSKDFTCFDGTNTIPFSYVNDDYCDCFDGSDEPGTSACLNSVFHCTNAGHRPQNIPSSRVNDGICDCCDGTDEYAAPNTCSNTCDELGREARAQAQQLAELHKAGNSLRLELIEKGNIKRSEMGEQLSQLEKDKIEALKIKEEKEALKSDIEAKENEALKVYREAEEKEKERKAELEKEELLKEATEQFNKYDSDNDGLLSVNEIRVVNVFDKNKDGEVDQEEIQYFFGDSENVDKDTFVSSVWSLLKPLLMMEEGMFRPEQDDQEEHDEELPHEEEQHEQDQEGEEETEDNEQHDLNIDDQINDQAKTYDDETKRLMDEASEARRLYNDAERAVREIESNIRTIQQNLEKDYGLNQEYATMDGECLEHEDKEYVYRLCLFDRVTQKSRNGGGEVGLGNWGEWGGDGDNKYSIMKYTNGVTCWNGPARMTTVHITCGLETKLTSVTEPYRCEYKIDLTSPAACDDSHFIQQQQKKESHDEL